ncbi:NADPH-dependent FMN reductase [Ensifer sp. BR816]|uniref:NADPH-dependent FMN reductase n=1 Tax=Rhizobium sp. (strain BR816) TaxID=1057002 RepID=UPI00036D3DA0|nr:NAD(P)H-dependent oxidoreductase [Ensifer sp. BR816]
MSLSRHVAVLVGSLRKESVNRKLALALEKLAPASLRLEIVGIGDLPLYNQDVEDQGAPASWVQFRDRIRAADAVLFITPEYNRSVPGVLKNALDVGSRPYGKSAWNGKPGAVVGTSPGMFGGFGAVHHLRQSLVSLNVPVLQQPEVYLSGADKIFDAYGNIANESTRSFLQEFLHAFEVWIDKTGVRPASPDKAGQELVRA